MGLAFTFYGLIFEWGYGCFFIGFIAITFFDLAGYPKLAAKFSIKLIILVFLKLPILSIDRAYYALP